MIRNIYQKINTMATLKREMMMALAITGMLPKAMAQTALELPPIITSTQSSEVKQVKAAKTTAGKQSLTMFSPQDMLMKEIYERENGGQSPVRNVVRNVANVGDKTETQMYYFTGFNAGAGENETNTEGTTGGWVNFNIYKDYSNKFKPTDPGFSCDTISTDSGSSPYSVLVKDKVYSFLPISADGITYTNIKRTIYDANTMKVLDSRMFNTQHGGDKEYIPYLLAYDDMMDVVYAITIGSVVNDQGNSESRYYLNMVDTTTCNLKRIGLIGTWSPNVTKGNKSIKGFTAYSGMLYVHWFDDTAYLGKINTNNYTIEEIGSLDIPKEYAYGQQPLTYDAIRGRLLINHYDFNNGTQYYYSKTSVPYGSEEKVVPVEHVCDAPTGYTWFYQRPEAAGAMTYEHEFPQITDLKITMADGDDNTTISFTTPKAEYADGSPIEFPEAAYKKLNLYLNSSNHTDNFYITSPFPRTLDYNTHYEGTVALPKGLNTISLKFLSSDYGLSIAPLITSETVVVGYDAPEAVANAHLDINGTEATITWEAPAKGRYSDFNSTFDAADLTYRVVRNDGYVVADGITATTVTDNTLPEEMTSWSYTVYAISQGSESLGAETNRVAGGNYQGLPYEETFSVPTCLDAWTVIDLDTEGSILTWRYSMYAGNVSTPNGRGANDWLITPSFKLKAGNVYRLSALVKGCGDLDITYGQGNTVEAQSNLLAHLTETENITQNGAYNVKRAAEVKDYYITPEADGTYNFGFFDNSGAIEGNAWAIDNVKVQEVAKADAPAAVKQLKFTPADGGALSGTLSFILPTTTVKGEPLSAITGVNVYDVNDKLVATLDNATAGTTANVSVDAVHGENYFYVSAVNEAGNGYPQAVYAFVGPDQPAQITGLKLTWGEDDSMVNVDFDKVSVTGRRGGYVDPATVKYHIYKYDKSQYPSRQEIATTDANETVEFDIQDITAQQQIAFTVTASNSEGESLYKDAGIVIGKAFGLPYLEPFSSKGLNHGPYILHPGLNNQNWTIDQGVFDTNIQAQGNDGIALLFAPVIGKESSAYFETPIIDFTTAKHPQMTVWLHHTPGISENAKVSVTAMLDGSSITALSDTVSLTGGNGWQKHVFNLDGVKGKRAQLALMAYAPTPADRIWADNFSITDVTAKDLAITGISETQNVKVGDKVDVAVTVGNVGVADATDYSVLFNVNGEALEAIEAEETLKSGAEKVFHFTLPVTAYNASDLIYSATVDWADDENNSNDESSEVEVVAENIALNAPQNVAISGGKISWTAPEPVDGFEVLQDFENENAFQIDNISGWNTIDGDGHLTTSFTQYYGNWWPYIAQPLAFMVWSKTAAGRSVEEAPTWHPKNGDKCLISWGNYGADARGRYNISEPEDDWFISPALKAGSELTFQMRANDAATVEILTSSTGRDKADFTNVVKTVNRTAAGSYSEVSATLPDDARYVAIHVTKNSFGILIDDMKYTLADGPKLLGYNVYGDNGQPVFTTDLEMALTSSNKVGVTAVYDLGESQMVSIASGISTITDDTNSTEQYYDLNGCRLNGIPQTKGVIIVKKGNKVEKRMVR